MLHVVTLAAFGLHIAGGMIGLVSGMIALITRKGGRMHRRAGAVFFAAMLVMAIFAIYLGFVMPGQLVNVFIGTLTLYLLATARMAAMRPPGTSGLFEKLALGVAVLLSAPFVILSVQLATGLPPLFNSAVPFKGPVLIAIYVFTIVLLIATISDLRLVIAGGVSGAPRIARHLWRMCLGLTLAIGSAFTNGLARLLPGPYHVPQAFFYPQLIMLAVLVVWVVRVRMTGWSAKQARADVA